jgi:hypothetical protein
VAFDDLFDCTRIGINVRDEAGQISADNSFVDPNNTQLLIVDIVGESYSPKNMLNS